LLSKQAHSLEWKKLLKTHQLFLLPLLSLLFVLLSPHQLLVGPSLSFSVPQTSLFLSFLCRLGWFGPATFPWGWLCALNLRLFLHLFHSIKQLIIHSHNSYFK
jgi:hypothetical protein